MSRMAGSLPLLLLQLLLILAMSFGKTAFGNEETDYEPVSLNVTFTKDQDLASKSECAI